MKDLINKEEEKAVFCFLGKFDLGPVLNVVGNTDKDKKKPDVALIKIGPAKDGEAPDNDKNMKEEPPAILEFQGMDLIKLQEKVSDKMT